MALLRAARPPGQSPPVSRPSPHNIEVPERTSEKAAQQGRMRRAHLRSMVGDLCHADMQEANKEEHHDRV